VLVAPLARPRPSPVRARINSRSNEVRFAADSPVEEDGFELSVPGRTEKPFRNSPSVLDVFKAAVERLSARAEADGGGQQVSYKRAQGQADQAVDRGRHTGGEAEPLPIPPQTSRRSEAGRGL
jgi:hypothetical protein